MDLLGNLSLGSKLANNLNANVYVIKYLTNNNTFISNMVFPPHPLLFNCQTSVGNEAGKALALEASYKAFHDLRKILKERYLDSASIKNIDPNNFFMIGSSAGAVLALNTLFLQKNEIPSSISYKTNCSNNDTNTIVIDTTIIKNQYWPMPVMKGIVSMAGAWIYDNTTHLTANTPTSSLNTPLLLMHGMCDELISRKEGRIGFKVPFNSFAQNGYLANLFISGKGSEYIFNVFKETHRKMIYGQVKNGSHGVFSNNATIPAWDLILNSANILDPVTTEIQPFIQNLINGTSNILTYTKTPTIVPEKASNACKTFDSQNDTICFYYIPTPTIDYNNNICHSTTYTASINNLPPAPYTISWTATGNIKTIGTTTGISVQYSSVNTGYASGVLKATITRGCSSKVFEYTIDVNKVKFPYINMASYCYSGHMGTVERELPAGSQLAIFNNQYTNAQAEGITGYEWELFCGTSVITNYITNNFFTGYMISSLLFGPVPANCTQVRFRYYNTCGQLTQWFSGYLKGCPEWVPDYLIVYPNPTNSDFKIAIVQNKLLELDDEAKELIRDNIAFNEQKILEPAEGIEVLVVDITGNIVHKTTIKSTDEQINISHLKPDLYKIVVTCLGQTYYSTLIKN